MDNTFVKYFTSPTLIKNSWVLFISITTISILVTFSGQYLLLSDELYFNALSEQMTFEQIKILVDQNNKWSWLTYVILPIVNLFKFTLVSTCLSLGCYLVFNRWTFNSFFRIAIQAEMVLVIPSIVKLLWFLFIQTDYSLQDLQYFYPLSLLNLFDVRSTSSYLLYPLQLVNLFELIYWIALTYGVSQIIKSAMPRALGLVAVSYGLGLLVWVLFIMFLTVSLS